MSSFSLQRYYAFRFGFCLLVSLSFSTASCSVGAIKKKKSKWEFSEKGRNVRIIWHNNRKQAKRKGKNKTMTTATEWKNNRQKNVNKNQHVQREVIMYRVSHWLLNIHWMNFILSLPFHQLDMFICAVCTFVWCQSVESARSIRITQWK